MTPLLLTQAVFLAGAVVDDILTKKIHNALIVVFFAAGLGVVLFTQTPSWELAGQMGIGFVAAFCLGLIPYSVSILGGGDFKLLLILGFFSDPETFFKIFVFSIVWGGIFGLILAILRRETISLLNNLMKIAVNKKGQKLDLHRMPFSVAIFFGWASVFYGGFNG